MRYEKSTAFLKLAESVVPLGSQTFSKSKVQYPVGIAPQFIERGCGARVWDIDGNEYVDFVNSLLATSIGHRNEAVDTAVREQLEKGVSFLCPLGWNTRWPLYWLKSYPAARWFGLGKMVQMLPPPQSDCREPTPGESEWLLAVTMDGTIGILVRRLRTWGSRKRSPD